MQPRERLTIKEMQVALLVWQGLTNYGEGSKELSAEHVRQTRSLEPAGTGALRRQPWWLEMERRVWFEA